MHSSPARAPFMEPPESIQVSAVFALPERQVVVNLVVAKGTTVTQAVEASGLRRRFPQIGDSPSCAVFGRAVTPDYVLRPGDRVEILRPLLVDPKEGRRRAAALGRGRGSTRS